jgi:DNA ligase-1
MKAMLASDYDAEKLVFPYIQQPKIDGVRGLNFTGTLTGRSLDPHANLYTTRFYSEPEFVGFDGEMAAEHQCHPRLCSLTTSAVNTIAGSPYTLWWLFDYVTGETKDMGYEDRYIALEERVLQLQTSIRGEIRHKVQHLRIVPSVLVENADQMMEHHSRFVKMGYEGSILRKPDKVYKHGRSTAREGGLLRIKEFADAEGRVLSLEEGQTNLNEATKDSRGYTERSTHAENMIPNGQVGAMLVATLEDIVVNNGAKVIPKGFIQRVAAGCMTHDERAFYFNAPEAIVGDIIKFQHFPKGVKDALRFATFQTIRAKSDL